ncbi:MAG: FecR family protein [Candidatus Methylumidiphilus sp.]
MNTTTDSHLSETSEAQAEAAAAWFARLRSETVSAEERARFAAWLEESPAHRRAYEDVRAFWDDSGFAEVLRATPLSCATSKRRHIHAKPRRGAGRWLLALAASIALTVVVVRPAAVGCWQADYCTAAGEVKTVSLEDGSEVTLNTDSAVSVDGADGLRHVRLSRGEAFFNVRRDSNRPFLVDARHSLTRVKGTQFVVREGSDADTVTVVSGVVEVSRHGENPAVLKANEQISVGDGAAGDIHKTPGAAAAWMKGKIQFDNTPLAEVVAEIARYRQGVVLFNGAAALQALRVSGRFDIANTDQALESLAQTLPIRVYRITRWLVVVA